MSTAFVRAAQYSDADAICLLLHTKMNSKISVERWQQLMNYKWLDNKPDFGYVVESDGRVLGYCGMIYADRMIGFGDQLRAERMVSMSSWYLDKSLRGKGLGRDMLIECIKDPTLTYATLTNSKKPLAIVGARQVNFIQVLISQLTLTRFLIESIRIKKRSLMICMDMPWCLCCLKSTGSNRCCFFRSNQRPMMSSGMI